MFFLPMNMADYVEDDSLIYASDFDEQKAVSLIPEAIKVLELIADISRQGNMSEFIKRDVTDIIKTVAVGRLSEFALKP